MTEQALRRSYEVSLEKEVKVFHVVKDDGREVLTVNVFSKDPKAVRSRTFSLVTILLLSVVLTSPVTILIGMGIYGAITAH